MENQNFGEFRPIYDECDAEGCEGPCENPTSCSRKSPWSNRFKKVSFAIVVSIALLISLQKVLNKNSGDLGLIELPALTAGETSMPEIKTSVSFVYLPSKVASENQDIETNLDEATKTIRNAGGGMMLHKLTQSHEHFALLSNIYKLNAFPVVLVFGPNCCSKYVIKKEFTVDRFIKAYDLARSSSDSKDGSNKANCKDDKCK